MKGTFYKKLHILPHPPTSWGPEKPQPREEVAPLTLAGAAGAVVAPGGLHPPSRGRGATPVIHLAVGAAQPPADQALDVLDCGRRWRGTKSPAALPWASEQGAETRATASQGVGHPL